MFPFNSGIKQAENLQGKKIKIKGEDMNCPHCSIDFHLETAIEHWLGDDIDFSHDKRLSNILYRATCPKCKKMILILTHHSYDITKHSFEEPGQIILYPRGNAGRKPPPQEVKDKTPELAKDYWEACQIREISPHASAALGRRCLQMLLRTNEKFPQLGKQLDNSLFDEIKHVIGLNKLSSTLANKLDYIRHTGNFAAHPMKDIATGLIINIEPWEAEYTLDSIADLFDFYYVEPVRDANRKNDLNKKLIAAGKPPMK